MRFVEGSKDTAIEKSRVPGRGGTRCHGLFCGRGVRHGRYGMLRPHRVSAPSRAPPPCRGRPRRSTARYRPQAKAAAEPVSSPSVRARYKCPIARPSRRCGFLPLLPLVGRRALPSRQSRPDSLASAVRNCSPQKPIPAALPSSYHHFSPQQHHHSSLHNPITDHSPIDRYPPTVWSNHRSRYAAISLLPYQSNLPGPSQLPVRLLVSALGRGIFA